MRVEIGDGTIRAEMKLGTCGRLPCGDTDFPRRPSYVVSILELPRASVNETVAGNDKHLRSG